GGGREVAVSSQGIDRTGRERLIDVQDLHVPCVFSCLVHGGPLQPVYYFIHCAQRTVNLAKLVCQRGLKSAWVFQQHFKVAPRHGKRLLELMRYRTSELYHHAIPFRIQQLGAIHLRLVVHAGEAERRGESDGDELVRVTWAQIVEDVAARFKQHVSH